MNDQDNLKALFLEVVRQLTRCGMAVSADGARLLLAVLQHIVDGRELPTQSVLVAELGMSERRLRQAQHELVSLELLFVRRRGSIPNDVTINVDALAAWVGNTDLVCDQTPSGAASRSVKTQDQFRQPAGTTTSALSIPPPAPIAAGDVQALATPSPTARAEESQRGGRIGGRGVSPHGSGGRYGHGKNNPAALLPELADQRRMESFFTDAGIHLSETLRRTLHRWVRDGVSIDDVEYACTEAARHGSRQFAYVEKIVHRLKNERNELQTAAPGDATQLGPVSLDSYRAARGE